MTNLSSFESNKLWLGKLPPKPTNRELESLFSLYGPVERVALFPTRGYAVVRFRHKQDAVKAAHVLRHQFNIEFEHDLRSAPGFVFKPSDKDLIRSFLYNKVMSRPYDTDLVKNCDLYGDGEPPWKLWNKYVGNDMAERPQDRCLYFFTQLKTKSVNGLRINRRVGDVGTWKGEDGGIEVEVDEKIKGWKKRYKFVGGPPEQQGCWYMIQYSLMHPETSNIVLCQLKKNEKVQTRNLMRKRERDSTEYYNTGGQRLRRQVTGGHTNAIASSPVPFPNLEHRIEVKPYSQKMETAQQRSCFVVGTMMVGAAPTPLTIYPPGGYAYSYDESKEIENRNFFREFLKQEQEEEKETPMSMAGQEVLDEMWLGGEETEETTQAREEPKIDLDHYYRHAIRNPCLTIAPPPPPDEPPAILEYIAAPVPYLESEPKKADVFNNLEMKFDDDEVWKMVMEVEGRWMGYEKKKFHNLTDGIANTSPEVGNLPMQKQAANNPPNIFV